MAGDLEDLMARAAVDVEASVAPVPTETLSRLRGVVRRRRLRRHAVESVGALAVVGAVAVAAVLGGQHDPLPAVDPTPAPTVSVTPSPTPSPTSTPSPSPGVEAAGPVVREAEIADATVLARLSAPRTGEVWTTPQRVDPLLAARPREAADDWYLVGHRGAADIYATTGSTASLTEGEIFLYRLHVALYEHEAGVLRRIVCPSARTGDACSPRAPDPAVEDDSATFYDTLTPPRTVRLPGGYTVRTGATWTTDGEPMGDMGWVVLGHDVRLLADLGGGLQVVERTVPADPEAPEGLRTVQFALRLPYGALVDLAQADVPGGDSATITWDDGVSRADDSPWDSRTAPPGGRSCGSGMFSAQTAGFDPSAWTPAGRTSDGRTVYTPAPGRLELATVVFDWQEKNSRTLNPDDALNGLEGADAYPFDSVEQLVAERALFALQGPGDEWLLGLRNDAMNTVFECA
ncbi:hypothetical protein [Cellulomonas sp. S1-8]|uniref:hypothetical protein n=1 Tax=Cellulomonas sp. S1-8 TaxID=2904790 RepID=UPI002243DA24|nr:hypothetical protein [Cellulomonas sp. S1-8]UZN02108.1 hypothetical protein OKX07_13560 [Cellulomonas sp. S1-8]